MKRLLTLVAFFATLHASAQQVNPVPDYVFANRMSAGRNTVTDTAAYFSIGPRYGATRGMMPPMVVDTASFSANKRNGLLIFSVQKNKFLYWDSVGVKWAEMAGTGGTAISSGDTAAMLLPYVRHAGYGLTKSGQSFLVDTLNIATRAWRQKGLDSLAALEISGSGTINRVPKFTASGSIGNGSISDSSTSVRMTIQSNGRIGINTTTDAGYQFDVAGSMRNTTGANFATTSGNIGVGTESPGYKLDIRGTARSLNEMRVTSSLYLSSYNTSLRSDAGANGILQLGNNNINYILAGNTLAGGFLAIRVNVSDETLTSGSEALRITSSGEVLINTQSDAGDYKLQVNGNSLFSGNIRTAAPAGGTANDWRLGTVATVTPTSPNRTIEVSIGGTIYYIHAKTTND